jgi:ribosome-binding protein aMBF1 (putative translation factor)
MKTNDKRKRIAEMEDETAKLMDEIRATPGYAEAAAKFDKGYAVAKALDQARQRAKMTQTEVALRMGVRQSFVSRIESGNANVTLEKLEDYAKAVGGRLAISVVF